MIEKFYAIRWQNGNTAIKHGTWEKVSKIVQGHPGVIFKSFIDKEDAEDFLLKKPVTYREADTPFQKNKIYVFVDGSYSSKRKIAGWGWVAVMNNEKIAEGNGVITTAEMDLSSCNICGEITAALEAMKWFVISGLPTPYVIVHDYLGISAWPLGFWNYSSAIARQYMKEVQPYLEDVEFEKCKGHSKIYWNDQADLLTRKGYDELL